MSPTNLMYNKWKSKAFHCSLATELTGMSWMVLYYFWAIPRLNTIYVRVCKIVLSTFNEKKLARNLVDCTDKEF